MAIENPGYYFKWMKAWVKAHPHVDKNHSVYYIFDWIVRLLYRKIALEIRYKFSKLFGTQFHKSIDYIRDLRYDPKSVMKMRMQS